MGNSPLPYRKNFPTSGLKIDRAFIRDLPGSEKDGAICNAVLDLARHLSLSVVAEGASLSQLKSGVDVRADVLNAVLQSFIFGIALTFTALFQGYQTKPTPEDVSRATTRTVVIASLMVWGLDFILTALMFNK